MYCVTSGDAVHVLFRLRWSGLVCYVVSVLALYTLSESHAESQHA